MPRTGPMLPNTEMPRIEPMEPVAISEYPSETIQQIERMRMEDASLQLYNVLDRIGITKQVQTWCKEKATVITGLYEIKYKLLQGINIKLHAVGSYPEGLFRYHLNSDKDILYIYCDWPVVEDIKTAPEGNFHLVVLRDDVPSGYVMLEIHRTSILNENLDYQTHKADNLQKEFLERSDKFEEQEYEDRLLRTNLRVATQVFDTKKNGPAETIVNPSILFKEDIVFGYKFHTLPNVATNWIQRSRSFTWPSKEELEEMQNLPCHVVPASHHESTENKTFEWRISFTLQEQYIMSKLNSTQLKCYYLLKQIKEEIVLPRVGKSLSSYHCKTCLFYVIQLSGTYQWVPEKLIHWLLICVKLLVRWLEQGFCPNFFIPETNSFAGKIERRQGLKIKSILCKLLSEPYKYLINITATDVGKMFICSMSSLEMELDTLKQRADRELALMVLVFCSNVAQATGMLGGFCLRIVSESSDNLTTAVREFYQIIDLIEEYKNRNPQEHVISKILCLLLVHLHTHLASHLLVLATECEGQLQDWMICASVLHFMQIYDSTGQTTEVTCKLKLATALYMVGLTASAGSILTWLDVIWDKRQIIDLVNIAPNTDIATTKAVDLFLQVGLDKIMQMSGLEVLQYFVIAPVTFFPLEMRITPEALRFEMFRSFAMPESSVVEHLHHFFKWAVVDARVMRIFLKYQFQNDLSLTNLINEITMKEELCRFETTYNLIGWAAMKEMHFDLAAKSLVMSWNVCCYRNRMIEHVFKKHKIHLHNAAVWLMSVLSYQQWRLRQPRALVFKRRC